MKGDGTSAELLGRRLDQWLWFARLVKSRSLAARLCAGRAVMVNQAAVSKVNHLVRMADIIAVPQGAFRRTVRVLGLGTRRARLPRPGYCTKRLPLRFIAQSWPPRGHRSFRRTIRLERTAKPATPP